MTALVTYSALLFGVGYSLHDFGGITAVSQLLEFGVMSGFLLDTSLLAKMNPSGRLFFLLMNASMATLMALQLKPLLTVQQLVSLSFSMAIRVASVQTETSD